LSRSVTPPEIHVEPHIEVHVPPQEAPEVNVTVEPPKPRSIRVEEDEDGNRRYVQEP
jgi:hypothetical protein